MIMIIMTTIFVIAMLIAYGFLLYALIRNSKVYKFRKSMLDFIQVGDPQFMKKMQWFRSSSYSEMVWSFRNLDSFVVGEFAEEFFKWRNTNAN